jgi:hypothetical protein
LQTLLSLALIALLVIVDASEAVGYSLCVVMLLLELADLRAASVVHEFDREAAFEAAGVDHSAHVAAVLAA